ncbi:hypothetical protein, partial [Hominenteromicrobium sp.]|uniref:hypothetical protein n=1 Tax=Hominenteromicrobium sp. TaxID=3073581 RepID=UPI003AEF3406
MSASNRCAAEPFNFFALLFVLGGLRIEVLDEAVRHRGEDGHGFGIIDFMPTSGISMYTRPSDSGWRGVKNVRQFIWDELYRSFI